MLLQLVRSLDPSRYQAVVVLPDDLPYAGLLSDQLELAGASVERFDLGVLRRRYLTPRGILSLAGRWTAAGSRLRHLIRASRIDLVHTNTLAVWSGAVAARVTGRRHVWHVHESVTGRPILRRQIGRMVGALSDMVVVNSQSSRQALFGASASPRIQVLPNGVALPQRASSETRQRVRSEWQAGADDVVVAMIGRVSSRKGQRELLSAAAGMVAEDKRLRFVIVGGTVPGQEVLVDRLRARVAADGIKDHVTFTGFRRDVGDILDAIDVLVMPSMLPEGFGLAAVEAMAHSRPVIATRVGGLPEVVVDGVTGLLIAPGRREEMAAAIAQLASDEPLRRRMGEAGRNRVMNCYSLERYARRYREIYEGLL
jgi:glycosyltransferase involved in cell wall biosynthesis